MIQLKINQEIKDFLNMGNKSGTSFEEHWLYTLPFEILEIRDKEKFFITDAVIRVQKWHTVTITENGAFENLPTTPFPILVKKPKLQAEMWQYSNDSEYGHVWVTYESYRSVEDGDQWTEIQLP